MIKDATVARRVSDLMLEYGKKLDESVAEVQNICSNDPKRTCLRCSMVVGQTDMEFNDGD